MPAIPVQSVEQQLPGKDNPPPATLHWVPASYPIWGAGLIIFAVVFLILLSSEVPELRKAVLSLALHPEELRIFALGSFATLALLAITSHFRRKKQPVLPPYLRYNHAIFQGLIFAFALVALRVSQESSHFALVLDDTRTQLLSLVPFVAYASTAYLAWLWPRPVHVDSDLRPYQLVVQSLRDKYDLVLGLVRPEDWKTCEKGPEQWSILTEGSLSTNVFVFGGIGSGKTSDICYPIVNQLLGKFPDNDALRPSIMLMDWKGDNAEKVYKFTRHFGRDKEYILIRPGNELKDIHGKHVIPPSCFRTWNPVGGKEPAEIRANFLLDGLNAVDQATSRSSNSEYFERIEREFLVAAIAMFDAVMGHGKVNLYDLYRFCYDESYRESIANDRRVADTDAKRYFEKAIEVLDADQKTQLVSGLRAKLAPMATPVMQKTFCATDDSTVLPFEGFVDTLINRSGVIVFSVDQGEFGKDIARLLGVIFLRYFQQALLKRNTTAFEAAGNNMKRIVFQITDEASNYMNPGVAEFTSVSRQARTCSIYLTQGIAQIPDTYRDTVEGNFRTKLLLNVNDKLTLERFEFLFGTVKETKTNVSTSQNLNEVKHGMLTQTVSGKSQGLSVSTSTSEEDKPRFSASDLMHLGGGRAVVQVYDGSARITHPATAVMLTSWYKLKYHLFHPLEHPDVRCSKQPGKVQHDYGSTAEGGLSCSVCGHTLNPEQTKDYNLYRSVAGF